jgi:trimeric autotransporter adhesin
MKKFGLVLIISSLALAACTPAPVAPVEDAKIRVIHSVADAGKLNLFVDTKLQNAVDAPLDFKGFFPTTGYASFAPKKYTFEGTPPSSSKPLVTFDATFESAKNYTVMILGAVAGKVPARPMTPVVLEDNNTAPASGNFKIRLVDAVTDSTAATARAFITTPGASLTGVPLALEYGKASIYVELSAGAYQIRLTPSDTVTVLRDLPTFAFESGKVYTVIATDGALGSSLTVLVDRNP